MLLLMLLLHGVNVVLSVLIAQKENVQLPLNGRHFAFPLDLRGLPEQEDFLFGQFVECHHIDHGAEGPA